MNHLSWITTKSLKAIHPLKKRFLAAFGELRFQAALSWAAIVCRSKVRSERGQAPESLSQQGTSSRGHCWRSVGQMENFLDGVILHTCVPRFREVEEPRKPTQRVGIGPKP